MLLTLTALYWPVGSAESTRIEQSGHRPFPPWLSEQPIFHPVLSEEHASKIAHVWNTKGPRSGLAVPGVRKGGPVPDARYLMIVATTAFQEVGPLLDSVQLPPHGSDQYPTLFASRHDGGDARVRAGRSGEPFVSRQKLSAEMLGQGQVGGVVYREVVPEAQDPAQEPLVSVALEWKVQIVLNGFGRALDRDGPAQHAATKARGHLDVT